MRTVYVKMQACKRGQSEVCKDARTTTGSICQCKVMSAVQGGERGRRCKQRTRSDWSPALATEFCTWLVLY